MRSQTTTNQTHSRRMRVTSMVMTRRTNPNRTLSTKPRRRPLRVHSHAHPEGEVQGKVLKMIYRGRTWMRNVPQVHSLVKPAANSMEETTTRCKSEKMAYRSKASRLPQRTRLDQTSRAINPRRQISHDCEACSRSDPSSRVYGNIPWPPKFCPSS